MTLTELIPLVEQLSAAEKVRMIRVLAEDLDSREDISPFVAHKTYHLDTPYDCYGAGEALLNALNAAES